MVSALTIGSLVAVLAIAATVVVRLGLTPQAPPVAPGVPADVSAEVLGLPGEARILAVGQSGGVLLFVLEDAGGRTLHRLDAATGETLSVTPIRDR